MDTDLTRKINELIPRSIDDIIRKNRDLAELRLSTEADTKILEKALSGPDQIKDTIKNWRLISFCVKQTDLIQVLLLGDSASKNHPWITSPVVSIDFRKQVVLTASGSIYRLGAAGNGEPPKEHLICICAAFHSWGKSALLGIPEFFY